MAADHGEYQAVLACPIDPDIFAATYEPVEAAPGDSSTHEGGV